MTQEQFIIKAAEQGIIIQTIKNICVKGNRGFRITYTTTFNSEVRYKEFFNKALSVVLNLIPTELV